MMPIINDIFFLQKIFSAKNNNSKFTMFQYYLQDIPLSKKSHDKED